MQMATSLQICSASSGSRYTSTPPTCLEPWNATGLSSMMRRLAISSRTYVHRSATSASALRPTSAISASVGARFSSRGDGSGVDSGDGVGGGSFRRLHSAMPRTVCAGRLGFSPLHSWMHSSSFSLRRCSCRSSRASSDPNSSLAACTSTGEGAAAGGGGGGGGR